MQNHTTTAELLKFSSSNQLYYLLNTIFDGFPENKHPTSSGQPRVISRAEAELLLVAIDMHSFGVTLKTIKAAVHQPDLRRILAGNARYLTLETSGALSAYDEIDRELLRAMNHQHSMPRMTVDLRSVRDRVEAAIEYSEVHRWGFDKSAFGKLAKSQAEIRAARDAFIARQKAEGV